MIRATQSIRWRLQAWHGLLLLVVLVAFGSTAYYLVQSVTIQRVDQELQRRSVILYSRLQMGGQGGGRGHGGPEGRGGLEGRGGFEGRGRFGGPGEFPGEPPMDLPPPDFDNMPVPPDGGPKHGDFRKFGDMRSLPSSEPRLTADENRLFEGSSSEAYYYAIFNTSRDIHKKSTNAPATIPFPGIPKSSVVGFIQDRGTLREFVQPTSRGIVIMVGRDIAADLAETQRLAGWLVGAGAGVLLLGLAGGWWLTTRALRPITDISATAVKIAAGDLSQRISVESAETELGELAGVLNSTFSRLEAAFAQQVRFTSDAAHELRTPITVMLTQTQTALARERDAAEYRETLEACRRASVRMRKLIESLLELARLDSGQEPIGRATFDLAQIAVETVENIRPIASERPVSITTQLAATPCQGSPERIAQVVTNLLANAIHYNRENGTIQVTVEARDGFAILAVADTGLGIAPEDLPHIFERFYRADKARTRARGHAGLGLSISKAIAETHGGTLAATSELGQGSVFTLRLPLAKNGNTPNGTAAQSKPQNA